MENNLDHTYMATALCWWGSKCTIAMDMHFQVNTTVHKQDMTNVLSAVILKYKVS